MWYKFGFCKSFLEQIYLPALYCHTNSVITQVIVQVPLKHLKKHWMLRQLVLKGTPTKIPHGEPKYICTSYVFQSDLQHDQRVKGQGQYIQL